MENEAQAGSPSSRPDSSRPDKPAGPPSEPPGASTDPRSHRYPRRVRGRGRRVRRVDLSRTLFVLPNALTLGAVFCGFSAIRLMASPDAGVNEFYRAAVLLIFAMFFDLLDGRVARITKTQSAFGLQLDSLADVISFGVAPALLVYQWVLHRHGLLGLLASFSFVACAAIRLARFNVLTTSSSGAPIAPGKYMVGLPSPPASGVLISLVVANHALEDAFSDPRYSPFILVATIVVALLMVSTVRFRSFKDLRLNAGTLLFVLFVVGSSAFVWNVFRPGLVLGWLLGFYLLIGLVETLRAGLEKLGGRGRAEARRARHPG